MNISNFIGSIVKVNFNLKLDQKPTMSKILVSSAVSKMIASSVTYPHEVIRTRMHTQSSVINSLPHMRYAPSSKFKPQYHGVLQSAQVILNNEGLVGFYRGFGLNLIRTVPASAVTILTFEIVRNALDTQYII